MAAASAVILLNFKTEIDGWKLLIENSVAEMENDVEMASRFFMIICRNNQHFIVKLCTVIEVRLDYSLANL